MRPAAGVYIGYRVTGDSKGVSPYPETDGSCSRTGTTAAAHVYLRPLSSSMAAFRSAGNLV